MFLVFLTCFISQIICSNAINCKGCVPLDAYSFDKIVSKFKAAIIKFDVAYPYGAKHDIFAKVAETTFTIPDLLVGEVGVKDYGERENSDLAEKYSASKDFPVLKLFIAGKSEPITFTNQEFTADNIKKFIRSNSEVYVGLHGCIDEFDKFAEKFAKTDDEGKKRDILKEAEDALTNINEKLNKKAAEVYVKTMQKSLEKGNEFILKEIKRVENLAKGKVSTEKKEQMQQRINILQSFVHEEL